MFHGLLTLSALLLAMYVRYARFLSPLFSLLFRNTYVYTHIYVFIAAPAGRLAARVLPAFRTRRPILHMSDIISASQPPSPDLTFMTLIYQTFALSLLFSSLLFSSLGSARGTAEFDKSLRVVLAFSSISASFESYPSQAKSQANKQAQPNLENNA